MDKVRQERRKNRHLNERFFIILEDFVNQYKIAKSHPDVEEYSNTLANTQAKGTLYYMSPELLLIYLGNEI